MSTYSHLLRFHALVCATAILANLLLFSCQKPPASSAPNTSGSNAPSPARKEEATYHFNPFNFTYLTAKGRLIFSNNGRDVNTNADLRMKKDSAIWISLRPGLGIEAARIFITPDSVRILDKLNNDFLGFTFDSLSKRLDIPVDFQVLQNTLLGNLPYQLETATPIAEGEQFILRKQHANVDVVGYVGKQTARLEKLALKDRNAPNSLNASYGNFTNVEGMLFPFVCNADLSFEPPGGNRTNLTFRFTHSKVELSKEPLTFPFSRGSSTTTDK
ncbi:MAG: DUF4292 domain-containing protein [Cytophagales bacterium]|nr:DUF4292 domain-containing protein [Bernardetiaceae bacterium]MDW8204612.1 DUF4292 domain-containing protein [Cytophagales bacterium]